MNRRPRYEAPPEPFDMHDTARDHFRPEKAATVSLRQEQITVTARETPTNKKEHAAMTVQTHAPAGWTPVHDTVAGTTDTPDPGAVMYYAGPRFEAHGLTLAASWEPELGVVVRGQHVSDEALPVEDLPALAAALLRYYADVRTAARGER